MCANVESALGPEPALLSQWTSPTWRDAQIRGVLCDELDGALAESVLANAADAPRNGRSTGRGLATALSRLLGRTRLDRDLGVARPETDGPKPLDFPRASATPSTGGRR